MIGKRILVTGARGYLGGRLIQFLAQEKADVIGTTRKMTSLPSNWPNSVRLVEFDHTVSGALSSSTLEGIDCVIHLAAANELRSASDPDAAINETGLATRHLIDACIRAEVGRFIFVSTIHVYGSPLKGELIEDKATMPVHPYAISHRLGEAFTLAAGASGQIQPIVVRLSNALGAPASPSTDRWTLVCNDFIRQGLIYKEIKVKNPLQWRDFIIMGDFCRGISLLCEVPADRLGSGIFNLGSGRSIKILDLANMIASISTAKTGCATKVVSETFANLGEPTFKFNINRILELGYEPSNSEALEHEIKNTIEVLFGDQSQPLF